MGEAGSAEGVNYDHSQANVLRCLLSSVSSDPALLSVETAWMGVPGGGPIGVASGLDCPRSGVKAWWEGPAALKVCHTGMDWRRLGGITCCAREG